MKKRTIAAGMIGEILEWYDFTLYGFFAPVLAQLFFPHHNPFISILATFGGFAAGYFMRPIGGIFFGQLGDRIGRKKALGLTLMCMAIPTVCMGLLPTHAEIGIAAPIILILLRLLQGFSCGGENTGSIIFLYEHATQNRRGFFSSLAIMGSFTGGLFSFVVIGITTSLMSHQSLLSWGWRIPFLVGIFTAMIGIYIRLKVLDSPVFETLKMKNQIEKSPIKNMLKQYKKTLFTIVFLNAQSAVMSYIMLTYLPSYFITIAHMPLSHMILLNIIAISTIVVTAPFIGLLSDKIGSRQLLIFTGICTTFFTYPFYHLLLQPKFSLILMSEIVFGLLISFGMVAAAKNMAEITLPHLRFSCVSLGSGICVAVFGGTAPFIATLLVNKTHMPIAPAFYVILAGLMTFFAMIKLVQNYPNCDSVSLR